MDVYEVLDQVIDLLHTRRRVAYRALKRQFYVDDNYLENRKDAILYAHPQMSEERIGV